MSDNNLSSRAGLNVGIEPTLLPFVQTGAAKILTLSPTQDTVVAGYSPHAARVPLADANGVAGYLYNTGGPPVNVDFVFIDDFGNEISLTGGLPVVLGEGPGPVPIVLPEPLRFFCLAPGETIVARPSALRDPEQVLGPNLAVWLQGDRGTGAGPNITTWVNQVPNGDAVQDGNPDAPTLAANAFNHLPGVSFNTADSGLVLTLTTPLAVGARPYTWSRAKLNQQIHVGPGFQALLLVGTPPAFPDTISLAAYPTGRLDANAYWDYLSIIGVAFNDTFETLTPPASDLDSLPHTFQTASLQTDALVVDGRNFSAPTPILALSAGCTTLYISNNAPAGAPPGFTSGFWNVGVIVVSFDQPTPRQIAEVATWCAAYGS